MSALAILILSTVSACTEKFENSEIRELSSVDAAQSSFAKVLSMAVSENIPLRSFIKNTALKEFDYDYDVFYPFVKDKVVVSGKTFREILLEYCTEEELCTIEQTLPKLDILVPDWKWLGCFSLNSWDETGDDGVAVSYVSENGGIELFENGESLGELPSGTLPAFPVLIIKENERMTYTPATKGSEAKYGFVDSAFENIGTKVKDEYYEEIVDGTPDTSNFVPASKINYRVKEAYEYFPKGPSCIYQRDYLYYNMTAPDQTMPPYKNIDEYFYKFKFTKFYIPVLFDDNANEDFDKTFLTTISYKGGDRMCQQHCRNAFYSEGCLELDFQFIIPENGTVLTLSKPVPVSFSEVFCLDHVNLHLQKGFLRRNWYVYTIDVDAIKPKWCVVDIELPDWDPSAGQNIAIDVFELDVTGNTEYTHKYTLSNASNINASLNAEGGDGTKWKAGLGFTYSDTDSEEVSVKITTTQGSDKLGSAILEYVSPVVTEKLYKNGELGYIVKTISTGNIDMMILPRSY